MRMWGEGDRRGSLMPCCFHLLTRLFVLFWRVAYGFRGAGFGLFVSVDCALLFAAAKKRGKRRSKSPAGSSRG